MIEYTLFTLANGLRVVHHEDCTTGRVALNLLYNVGARDESPQMTGLAHLFEHLMFGGSVNVPEFDYAMEMAGGNNNAWTSNDFTNFYCRIPAENVETAFWAESDRMLSLAFSEESLRVQRDVVMEEFKQVCLNKPYGDMGHHLRGLIFKKHPYRFPTIGKELSHIERVTMDDVKQFFYSHYAPNNAVLAVAGNISLEKTRDLAEKWFGDIPARDIVKRSYDAEPEQTEARRLVVKADVPQTRIVIAFPMGGASHPDYRVADLLTDILASGNSSRFYRQLVMGTDIFTMADASISGSDEPGYLMVHACLRNNGKEAVEAAERVIWQQLYSIASELVQDSELERALNRFETNNVFSRLSYVAKAEQLAKAVMQGRDINSTVAEYRRVTVADIKRVASEILQRHRSNTLIYEPAN